MTLVTLGTKSNDPQTRGSIHTAIVGLKVPKIHNSDGLLEPNSTTVVYLAPIGSFESRLDKACVAKRRFGGELACVGLRVNVNGMVWGLSV